MNGLENLIPLHELANYLPRRRGKKLNYSTIYRWTSHGCRGRRLATTRIGGVLYVSADDLRAFLERGEPSCCDIARTDRLASIQRAEQQVADDGI